VHGTQHQSVVGQIQLTKLSGTAPWSCIGAGRSWARGGVSFKQAAAAPATPTTRTRTTRGARARGMAGLPKCQGHVRICRRPPETVRRPWTVDVETTRSSSSLAGRSHQPSFRPGRRPRLLSRLSREYVTDDRCVRVHASAIASDLLISRQSAVDTTRYHRLTAPRFLGFS